MPVRLRPVASLLLTLIFLGLLLGLAALLSLVPPQFWLYGGLGCLFAGLFGTLWRIVHHLFFEKEKR